MRNVPLRLLLLGALIAVPSACVDVPEQEPTPTGWTTSEDESEDEEEVEDVEEDVEDEEPEEEEPDVEVPAEDLQPNGASCSEDSECEGGTCLRGPSWPGGYCTQTDCGTSCDANAGCVQSASESFCAEYCASDDECRDGYACSQAPGSPGRVCVAPVGLPDGSACAADSDCQGGACITDWPGGFCTTVGCEDFTDCSRQGNENRCLRVRGPDICVRICQQQSDCRDDYLCELFPNGEGMCVPDPAIPLDDAVLTNTPFDVTCTPTTNGTAELDYDIGTETVAYMVTPLTKDGRRIGPDKIALPAGDSVDFGGTNYFQTIPAQLYGGMNPTVVPATEAYQTQLQSGTHTYSMQAEGAEVCHYVLEEKAFGDKIDLNIYFVDIPGLNSGTAATHEDLQEVLTQFDEIYGEAGVTLGKVRYYDVTGDAADRFGVLRSEGDLSAMVALSEPPGPTMDDVLSVNIFFVRAMALGGAIGISSGLPGPAALHGTHGSGVAFTAEYLGGQAESSLGGDPVDGNVFTGQILAHEVGHYLGLFHTSEQGGYSFDPLPDTPECSRISLNCPDLDNLMFPFAGASHVQLTPNQAFVLGVNPLTKLGPTTEPTDPMMGGN